MSEIEPLPEVYFLLIEDCAADAELTIQALRAWENPPRIVHFSDGEKALDFLTGRGEHADGRLRSRPVLVLLDLKLPRMSGFEVLQALKGADETRDIPVVVLTSSGQESDIQAAYDLGANGYTVKPVDFREFSEVIGVLSTYWLKVNRSPG